MENICEKVKSFLDSPKSEGGAGCTPGQHHGGQYNGKDVAKIFNVHEELFKIVPDAFTKKKDYKVLFSTLNVIFKKVRLARFLSPEEIHDLEQIVVNLSTIIFLKFKKTPITVKMHDILVHMVKFVQKYHTVGLFSEQGLEGLHQVMHTDEKKYQHMNKQPVMKTKAIMNHQNLRALL